MTEAPPDPFASQRETLRKGLFGVSVVTSLVALLGVPLLVGDLPRFYTGRYPDGVLAVAALLMIGFSVPGVLFTILVRRWTTDSLDLLRVVTEVTLALNGFGCLYGLFTLVLTFL